MIFARISSKKDSAIAWVVCISAALFFFFDFVQLVMPNSLGDFLLNDLGIDQDQRSRLCFFFSLGNFLLLLPAVVAIDRYSLRHVTLSALIFSVIGAFGATQSKVLWVMCIFRFISGAAHAFCFLCCSTLVSRWFSPEKRGRVMGTVVAIGLLGALMAQAPLVLLAKALGWRGALLVNVGVGVCSLVATFCFVQDYPVDVVPPANQEGNTLASYQLALCNKKTWLHSLYIALINSPYMGIVVLFLNDFLRAAHGISENSVSTVATCFFLGNIVGNPIWGLISERWHSRKKPMLWGGILCLCSLLFFLYCKPMSAVVAGIGCFILGFCISVQVVAYPAIIESNPPALVTASMSIASFVVMGSIPLLQWAIPSLVSSIHNNGGTVLNSNIRDYATYAWGFVPLVIALVCGIVIAFFSKETYGKEVGKKH